MGARHAGWGAAVGCPRVPHSGRGAQCRTTTVNANIKINNEIFTVSVQKNDDVPAFLPGNGAAVHVGAPFMTPGWRRCGCGDVAGVYCVGLRWGCGRHKWRPYDWRVISGIYGRTPEAPFGASGVLVCALCRGSDELDAAFEELVEGLAFEQSVLQESDVDELVYHGLPGAVVGEHFGLLLFLGGDVLVAL